MLGCVQCPYSPDQTRQVKPTLFISIGPSGVRALPLGVAAKRSVHYIWYYFCQAQSQLQVKLSLKTELALFFINPATRTSS